MAWKPGDNTRFVSRAEMINARNERVADLQNAAHERFVQRRTNFIESNPNAVSASERASFLGRRRHLEDEDRLRAHELKMLEQTGKNAEAVESKKTEGVIGAAAATAEAAKYTADANKEAALKKAETDAIIARGRDGYFDDAGVYHAGSDVTKADLATKATLENARLEREARIAAAEKMAGAKIVSAETNAAAKVEAAKVTGQNNVNNATQRNQLAEDRAYDTWLKNLNDPTKSAGMSPGEKAKIMGMTPEERRQYWREITGRSFK